MKNTPLIINWHDQNAPIYSAHFEPHGKGRLATAAGDNNVRVRAVYLLRRLSSARGLALLPANALLITLAALEDRGGGRGQKG